MFKLSLSPLGKSGLLFFLLGASLSFLQAQSIYNATTSVELVMPEGDGRNGACVVWHPDKQCYYAVFAGNAAFPLAVFDAAGTMLGETVAGFDTRGLWYNKKTQMIEGNGYDETGIWALLIPSGSKIPAGNQKIFEGMIQPNVNAVGAMDDKGKEIYYWDGSYVVRYNRKKGVQKGIIELDGEGEYNAFALIYTGIKGKELGLLDYYEGVIELFNRKTGEMTAKVRLPGSAPLPDRFNFAYTNGTFWLFDIEARTWVGYTAMIE